MRSAELSPDQRRALEGYARDLNERMRAGVPEAPISWEALRHVLGLLGYVLIWDAGLWRLQERD